MIPVISLHELFCKPFHVYSSLYNTICVLNERYVRMSFLWNYLYTWLCCNILAILYIWYEHILGHSLINLCLLEISLGNSLQDIFIIKPFSFQRHGICFIRIRRGEGGYKPILITIYHQATNGQPSLLLKQTTQGEQNIYALAGIQTRAQSCVFQAR